MPDNVIQNGAFFQIIIIIRNTDKKRKKASDKIKIKIHNYRQIDYYTYVQSGESCRVSV